MQEDDFKSKKSDTGDTDKKKKYELWNRKNVEDMNNMSLTLTDAISIWINIKLSRLWKKMSPRKGMMRKK